MANLNKDDIIEKYRKEIEVQDYSKKPQIDGVVITELKNFIAEDGFLCEVVRIKDDSKVENFDNFSVKQINISKVMPGAIKAWHLHFKQDDLWYIPPDGVLTVGLVDLRKGSNTEGCSTKLILGGGKSYLLYIPAGVAHGYANKTTTSAYVFYLVNEQFDIKNPDERRLPWNIFGADFWEVKPG